MTDAAIADARPDQWLERTMKFADVRRRLVAAAALVAVAVFAGFRGPEASATELILIGGQGDEVGVTAAALRTGALKTWAPSGHWTRALAPEWQIGSWNAQRATANKSQIIDSSVTAVLTMRPRSSEISSYYLDIGLGVHMLSDQKISNERNLGSRFQFGEFLGLGADLGEHRRYSLAARVQHVSNGGMTKPNPGVTFIQLLVMYHF